VQDVETGLGEVVQQLPEFGGQGFVRQFVGRDGRGAGFPELVDGTLPAFGFATGDGGELLASFFIEIFFAADVGVDGGQTERIRVVLQVVVEGESFFVADFG